MTRAEATARVVEAARRVEAIFNWNHDEAHDARREYDNAATDLRSALALYDSTHDSEGGWRHKKRGTTYRIEEPITIQCDTPIQDGEELCAYRATHDGKLWGRRLVEFLDGRFEPLPAPPTQEPTP